LPAYQWLWSMHDVAVGHQRRYDGRGVREKLARAGMHVERIFHVNALMLPFVAIQRLLRRYALKNGNHIVSDLQMNLPRWLNRVLSSIYPVEVRLEERVNFPFGLSVVAIARKK